MMRMRSILTAVAIALFVWMTGTSASAQVLPLIVDGSGDSDAIWWVDREGVETSPFSKALEEVRGSQLSVPSEVTAGQAISRIY
jgi:hypothetical protein